MIAELFSIVLLIAMSAFFSGAEIAFVSVNETRMQNRLDEKRRLCDKVALYIVKRQENALATVLIGNNLVNIAASSVATVIILDIFHGNEDYTWISTLVMTLLILAFGEILPKVVAKQLPESFADFSAVPVFVLNILFGPIIFLVNAVVKLVSLLWKKQVADTDAVSEDDLENIIDIVGDEGVIDEEQCDLLQNALDFESVLAYEVLTPRVDMLAIDIRDSFDRNCQILLDSPYTRIPVYEDTPDHIIGILHLNRFYKELVDSENEKVTIRGMLTDPVFVHKTMPLPDVLDKMRKTHRHMVIVLDEYGGTMGILTMEDVLEQLVGEIWDESDEVVEEFVCIDDTHYEASGDMRIYDFFDEMDIDIDETDFEENNVTLGGFATDMLDGEVSEGSSFTFENLTITVLVYENMRVERLAITVNEPEKAENGEDE